MRRLLVIGLDGMTWNVAENLEMPELESLIETGGSAELESTYPPVTCPAWPSFLTGKNPDKHEVYDFSYLKEDKSIGVHNYDSIETPGLIDALDEESIPSIFFEIPLTYPAPEGKPLVVAGYPARTEDGKFSPAGLRNDIESELGEFPPITPGRYTGNNREDVVESFFDATEYRKNAFKKLLNEQEWQFATCNLHLPDQFGHFFWNLHEESEDNTDPLSRAYRLLDDVVGELVDSVPGDTNVMVISDHGHGHQDHTVNLNYLLWREGYLSFRSHPMTALKTAAMRIGISPANVKTLADRLGLTWFMGIMKRSTRDKLLSTFLSFRDVDWEESEAYAFGHVGQIYWIGEEKDRRRDLKQTLLEAEADGQPLVDDLIALQDESSPDPQRPLWLTKMNGWADIAYPLLIGEWELLQDPTNAGCHRPEGILAWSGPDLATNGDPDARIIDIAPTAHRLLEIPPQEDFDGRVLTELLDEDAPAPRDPKQYGTSEGFDSDGDEEQVKEQLRNLGYL